MTAPDERRRRALDGLRQHLPKTTNRLSAFRVHLVGLVEKLPALREHLFKLGNKLPAFREYLLERADKITGKLTDNAQVKRQAYLHGANEGLKAYLPTEAAPTMSAVVSLGPPQDVPGAADEQLICDLIRWWVKHDPLSATRGVVDAVGLGGAHRLAAGDRLMLARAFLAMLDIDPLAARWVTEPTEAIEDLASSGNDTFRAPGSEAPLAATMSKKSADTSRPRLRDRPRRRDYGADRTPEKIARTRAGQGSSSPSPGPTG